MGEIFNDIDLKNIQKIVELRYKLTGISVGYSYEEHHKRNDLVSIVTAWNDHDIHQVSKNLSEYDLERLHAELFSDSSIIHRIPNYQLYMIVSTFKDFDIFHYDENTGAFLSLTSGYEHHPE